MKDALSAHEVALAFGGLPGVTNPGLVESAISRPYSGYHRSLSNKAAALAQSMAGNHGFADGNKRTTVLLLHILIRKSGFSLAALEGENIESALEDLVIAVVTHQLNFEQLCNWFEARLVRDS
jgi:death-on-curing protein